MRRWGLLRSSNANSMFLSAIDWCLSLSCRAGLVLPLSMAISGRGTCPHCLSIRGASMDVSLFFSLIVVRAPLCQAHSPWAVTFTASSSESYLLMGKCSPSLHEGERDFLQAKVLAFRCPKVGAALILVIVNDLCDLLLDTY